MMKFVNFITVYIHRGRVIDHIYIYIHIIYILYMYILYMYIMMMMMMMMTLRCVLYDASSM